MLNFKFCHTSDGIKDYLTKLRWPVGLQKILLQGVKAVPMKFFVCDDSGTMMLSDGHKVVADGKILKYELLTTAAKRTLQQQ